MSHADGAAGGGGEAGAGAGAALSDALELVVTALAHMQSAMQAMERGLERTDGAVRCVAQRLQRLEDKVNTLDKRPSEVRVKEDCSQTAEVDEREKEDRCTGNAKDTSQQTQIQGPEAAEAALEVRGRVHQGTWCQLASSASCLALASDLCQVAASRSSLASLPLPIVPAASSSSSAVASVLSAAASQASAVSAVATAGAEEGLGAGRHPEDLGRQLLDAVQDGRADAVRALLDAGADPNYTYESEWTPLHRAARKANAAVVAALLERGANANARTAYGFTALHVAVYNDFSGECAARLLAFGPDLSIRPLRHLAMRVRCGQKPVGEDGAALGGRVRQRGGRAAAAGGRSQPERPQRRRQNAARPRQDLPRAQPARAATPGLARRLLRHLTQPREHESYVNLANQNLASQIVPDLECPKLTS